MSKGAAPGAQRLFSRAWSERAKPGVVLREVVEVRDGEWLDLVFVSATATRRQGVWLKTDRGLVIEDEHVPSAVLWQDTSPAVVHVRCLTSDGRLSLYNVWDSGRGMQSQAFSSGMIVEEVGGGRTYRCNDVGFDEARFDKLVFRILRREPRAGSRARHVTGSAGFATRHPECPTT